MAGAADHSELERLRAENRALDEQIKLLVQTEQRFYRSQNQLDTQLVRLRRLASFALETTTLQAAPEILRRAVDVLDDSFDLDWVGAIVFEPGGHYGTVVTTSFPKQVVTRFGLEPAQAAELRQLEEPLVLPEDGREKTEPPAAVRALVTTVTGDPASCAGSAIVVPLGNAGGGRPGLLLGCSSDVRPRVARPEAAAGQQRPFLQLLANHVEHAVAGTELTESLRENAGRLERSLETLERTQQQLLQAQKMDAIGRLAGGVAHDFNNLLTVILGYAGALSASLPPGAPQQENVVRVLEAARRAADITSQLLALGRRQMRRLENLDLSQLTAKTADLLARLLGENIRVELDLDRSLPLVRADRAQVEQVLLNLVVNAREAMPSGGQLRVTTRRARAEDAGHGSEGLDPGRFVVLEVRDDGVGMDAATRAQVFEPFFSTKDGAQGSGLGLAVVYGIVKQTEGYVYLESEPGSGTTFTVLLPVAAAAGERTGGARAGDGGDGPPAPAVVLVVEDEPALAEVVRATLARAGHTVHVAGDGEQALGLLGRLRTPPDLVLTDVIMPNLGGLPMAERIAREHPGVRVAFMSGYSEDLLASLPEHSRRHLAKPFTPQGLLEFVAAELRARR